VETSVGRKTAGYTKNGGCGKEGGEGSIIVARRAVGEEKNGREQGKRAYNRGEKKD